MVTVQFRQRYITDAGALMTPGEQAGLSEKEARFCLEERIAFKIEKKALDVPPVDKQMKGAPVKKGGR